ncbi:MAG: branched-chain amino acid ABC transporter permease [Deltaproteobacteria bacterium]|nr:branched-chain amino acid ABC transporter permease [Deltaproteobacteria bacterium]MBW1909834.1 branched-chain amino acid ABC transporter permease [Deltaproteobacteria bacterium]MBW2033451.1 branched-chain amino acid ABC transporter permease [Deltaproteobacteria bacterium]MBW2114104.1 branched-chain amino acid ABC transporter permease [Deltaproteobacteria bacterium]MBW2357218.1 branched-chain amino acid ABC transporter permease [Deltaproteobacteria bacterium]
MNRNSIIFLAAVLLFLLLLPLFSSSALIGIFILIFFYAYLGQCWNILSGYVGAVSVGHALFVGIGAYISTKLALVWGLSPWIGMFLGGFCASIIALFIGYLGFRFRVKGVYFFLLTIAFAEVGRLIFLHLDVFGGPVGIFIPFKPSFINFQFKGNNPYYYIAMGMMIFSIIVVRIIEKSNIGLLSVAIREDEDAAQSLGVNSFKCKMILFFISGFMTALGGTFYANYFYYIQPDIVFGLGLSVDIILRPIVGGMGTVFGPVIGSFLMTPLAEFTRNYFAKGGYEGLHMIIYGIILIIVVLFFPRGLAPSFQRMYRSFKKNISKS